jgi:hypothetical protein
MAGDTVASYVRRLARANHLRPGYLHRYLQDPGSPGRARLDWLAALAGGDPAVMERALGGSLLRPRPRSQAARKPGRAVLFAKIRQDARRAGLSVRALADLHGVHRRTVRQALESAIPSPRTPGPPRLSRLDPYKSVIDDLLGADAGKRPQHRRTTRDIHQLLVTEHGAAGISYSTLRDYAARHRPSLPPRTEAPPGHPAASAEAHCPRPPGMTTTPRTNASPPGGKVTKTPCQPI